MLLSSVRDLGPPSFSLIDVVSFEKSAREGLE